MSYLIKIGVSNQMMIYGSKFKLFEEEKRNGNELLPSVTQDPCFIVFKQK